MATTDEHRTIAPIVGPDDPRRFTDSGIEIKPLYDEEDLPDGLPQRLGEPGEYPYTRGVHAEMYRKQLWTMRQYAGYASAEESNERYRYLLEHGSTGLCMAFDLPTQLGLDSDDPRCLGRGRPHRRRDRHDRRHAHGVRRDPARPGVDVDDDQRARRRCCCCSTTWSAEEQGVPSEQLRGTTQNDILKEYIARGNFIYPPEGAMRLTTDLFAYCNEHVPKWNTISISGYHFREKGCSAVQEVAFTLANGIAYVQAALDAGLEVDRFAPRLAFFFNGHNNVFQEVAKFRAARRMWAEIMRERFGAKDERSWRLRFHTQTGGVTLTAQQPENNIVRVALQGFAAVCGGTQSLHTNGFDEALALPTERAARIALRTQQILGYESGAADTVDPFAGSYFVEALTDEIETSARELIAKVDELGGSVKAIDFMKNEIEESAFGYHERYRIGQDIVVGVNKYEDDRNPEVPDILRVDPESEHQQVERLKAFKADRDQGVVDRRLEEIRECARGTDNMLPVLRQALKDRCFDGRGLRRDARRVRRLPAEHLALALAVELRHLRRGVAVAGGRVGRHRPLDRARSSSPSSSSSAPSASVSRSRVRAPTSGTMSSPRDSTQAIATWATVASSSSATSAAPRRGRGCAQVLALEARRAGAEVVGRAALGRPVAADQAAGEHAVGGDRDAELAAGRGSRPRCRARSASTRSAGRRSGARRRRGGSSPRRPRTGRCGGRSRPATSSAIAPTVSSIGTSGSRRAGR